MKINELKVNSLDELTSSWSMLYPNMSEEDINKISLSAKTLIPSGINYVSDADAKKEYLKTILLAAKKDQQVLLIGPKWTGKTTSIYYAAQLTNNPLVPIQLNGSTGVDTLIGKRLVNKEGTYRIDGLFTLAWRYGFRIILDELNLALPEVTAVLHPALDDRRILVLDEKDGEVIPRHPNCRIFAAINPTEDYAGTKEMNAALVDRFAGQIIVGYPDPIKERSIILNNKKVTIQDIVLPRTKDGVITRIVKVGNALRILHKKQKLMYETSTRNLIDRACRCSDMPIKDAFELAILSKADKEDYLSMTDELNKLFKDDESCETINNTFKTLDNDDVINNDVISDDIEA